MGLIICARKNALASDVKLMRTISRWVAAIFFVVAGTIHFLRPEKYLQIMPPYFIHDGFADGHPAR
jgi:hypothetical protein